MKTGNGAYVTSAERPNVSVVGEQVFCVEVIDIKSEG